MSVKRMYNESSAEDNLVKLHASQVGCCPTENETCKYEAPVDGKLTAITIQKDGVDIVMPVTRESDSPRDTRIAVSKALRANGYDPYYKDSWIGVTFENGKLSIIGEVVPKSITVNDKPVKFFAMCEMCKVTEYKGVAKYGMMVGNVSTDGIGGTPVGGPYGLGDSATLQADLETALTAEGIEYTEVIVEENAKLGCLTYKVKAKGETTICIDGKFLVECAVYPSWTAGPDDNVDPCPPTNDDNGDDDPSSTDSEFTAIEKSDGGLTITATDPTTCDTGTCDIGQTKTIVFTLLGEEVGAHQLPEGDDPCTGFDVPTEKVPDDFDSFTIECRDIDTTGEGDVPTAGSKIGDWSLAAIAGGSHNFLWGGAEECVSTPCDRGFSKYAVFNSGGTEVASAAISPNECIGFSVPSETLDGIAFDSITFECRADV